MKIIVPISSFLLAVISFYCKGIHMNSHLAIVKLYSIDAVDQQLKSEIVALIEHYSFFALVIGLISTAIAAASIYNKLCHKILGTVILIISVLSVMCSIFIMS